MSAGTRIAGVDFAEDLTRLIVFGASCCSRFWCETGAARRSLRLRDGDAGGSQEAARNALAVRPTPWATEGNCPGALVARTRGQHNLLKRKGRPGGTADVADLAQQVKLVEGKDLAPNILYRFAQSRPFWCDQVEP